MPRLSGSERSHKALGAPALGALVDVMYEAGLVRFGAGEAHLGAAFYALRVNIESPYIAIWHGPTTSCRWSSQACFQELTFPIESQGTKA
jgi:hypothetical protein